MTGPDPAMRRLAGRLLEASREHAGRGNDSIAEGGQAQVVYETLRTTLARFTGAEGFAALARRALALARAEAPMLAEVGIATDGTLVGFEDLSAEDDASESAIVLIAHLLTLLAVFVGDALMIRMVREGWPDASVD